ncbi:alpha/beta hydrolase family protein [Steroidobacter sp.]|uniref:S9 family peptidase n=1 Tax=Steroidobacter sp. TaxID=1978227 RepID=UPI001A54031F|nr:S9 family peptidase [Steroidobacter sp.]MBL8270218.1 S9 family peptidase [Steroidobacter sp.]
MRRVVTFVAALVVCSPVLVSAEGVSRRLEVDDFAQVKTVLEPQLSPDGRWVAYLVRSLDLTADESRVQLWQMSVDGRERLQLTHERKAVSSPRWRPGGQHLSFLAARKQGEVESTQLWVLDRRGGEAEPLTEIKGDLFEYAWSPDGKRLALVVRDTDGADEQRPEPYVIDRYQFKDDGEGYLHRGVRPARIYLYEVATKSLTALTTDARFAESSPVWSPDGEQLAFVSNRDEQWDRTINDDIWVADARPGATPRRLSTSPGRDLVPEWSPDGRAIVYLQGSEPRYSYYGPYKLAVVSVTDGTIRYPASGLDRDVDGPRFSADGRFIRFLVGDNRESYLAQVAATGGAVQRLTKSVRSVSDFVTSADRTILLSSRSTQPAELYALERGTARQLTSHNEGWLKDVALAATEDFQFTARDGTEIYGLLTRPSSVANNVTGKLPTVLWIHGGPYGQDSHGFHFQRQLFVAQGYAVLQINYRGSSGRGAAFGHGTFADWGNKDLTDLLDGVNQAIARGIADPERLMVGGWSNGGVMTNYVIARDARFKAAIAGAGYGNLISFYGSDMYSFVYDHEITPPWVDRERWLKLSYPLFEANKIRTPTLFVGGERDFNVPIVGSEQMYQALQSLKVPTQLVIYPGEHHGIGRPSFQRDLLGRYVAWFATHLGRGDGRPAYE